MTRGGMRKKEDGVKVVPLFRGTGGPLYSREVLDEVVSRIIEREVEKVEVVGINYIFKQPGVRQRIVQLSEYGYSVRQIGDFLKECGLGGSSFTKEIVAVLIEEMGEEKFRQRYNGKYLSGRGGSGSRRIKKPTERSGAASGDEGKQEKYDDFFVGG